MTASRPDFEEGRPPEANALVVFLPRVMQAFLSPPRSNFMYFVEVAVDDWGERIGWTFKSADPTNGEWRTFTVTPPYYGEVRKPTISEKDLFSRLTDPTARYRDANLRRVFRPDRD